MADFLAIILALITLYPIVKAMKIKEHLSPLITLWRKEGKVSRVIISLILIATIGIGSNKDFLPGVLTNGVPPEVSIPTNGVPVTQMTGMDGDGNPVTSILINTPVIPEWYLQTGYSTDDSDGDGIPDMWERLTRTDPNVNDGGADYDGDGVTNYKEFLAALDPHLSDTDGDRISDCEELERQNQGEEGFDPLEPIDYTHDEPDSDNNGIPDYWEDCGYPYGVNNLVLPPGTDDTFDAQITVTTTASALLKWSGGGVVLPPCTNQVVTVRVTATADGEISLTPHGAMTGASENQMRNTRLLNNGSPSPQNNNQDSTTSWYASMILTLLNGNKENIVRVSDNEVIELDDMEITYTGEPKMLSIEFRRHYVRIIKSGAICEEHGGVLLVEAYHPDDKIYDLNWQINGEVVTNNENSVSLVVNKNDVVSLETKIYSNKSREILLRDSAIVGATYRCHGNITNIIGAAWTSTHDPDNSSNHSVQGPVFDTKQFPCLLCPEATIVTYYAGFTHDESKLNLRNLSFIEDPYCIANNLPSPDHCIGIELAREKIIDLTDYLDDISKDIEDQLEFDILSSGNVTKIDRTRIKVTISTDSNPIVCDVILRNRYNQSETYDNMVMVFYSDFRKIGFTRWYNLNAIDLSWTRGLPTPYSQITISSNGTPLNPEGASQSNWDVPHTPGAYFHHNARYEMRTTIEGSEGNQATYDENGRLITSGIAAGTADMYAPYGPGGELRDDFNHLNSDVRPFIIAIQMDGNPGYLTRVLKPFPVSLDRPCIYQGEFSDMYLECRPIITR